MAGRCGCASDQCSCVIVAGENVEVSGTGTRTNPYVVSAATTVVDTSGNPPPADSRIVGEIIQYGGLTAPTGWLLCNGQAVNRAVYANLYAVLGTRFGAGDGSTTFNLPDFTGRFPMGPNGSNPVGTKGGSNTKTIATANLPAHTHSITHGHTASLNVQYATTTTTTGSGTRVTDVGNSTGGTGTSVTANPTIVNYTGNSGSTGSGTPLDITPAMTAVTFIIKA